MAKFKVGDRVKLNIFQYPLFRDKTGTITSTIYINESDQSFVYKYTVTFSGLITEYYVEEKWLELVEPKEDKPYKKPLILTPYSRTDILVNGKVKKYSIEKVERPCNMPNEPERLQVTFIELTEKLPSQELPNQDPFNLNPHEFDETNIVRNQDMSDVVPGWRTKNDFFPYFHLGFDKALYTKPPKNRIPDRVVFNQDKGKVTVLISKHLDGVAPYWAYTSKVHGDDEYNGYFGFMLSYYKYLNRHLGGDTRKELIDMAFQHGDDKAVFIIEGAVSQEVMKIVKIDEWNDILDAILEVGVKKNGYWDYLEWKEMLRVHELETKREEQKAIRKEIKKHEQEIEKLKKKGV